MVYNYKDLEKNKPIKNYAAEVLYTIFNVVRASLRKLR